MTKKPSAIYPYTLQTIAVNMSNSEFKQAQIALFQQSAKNYGVANIKTKEWIILAIVAILGLAGLFYVDGYSTALFWVMIIGVIIYLIARTAGMKWYMKREFEKQMAETDMPEEFAHIKLGVQKNGLVMNMPNPNANVQQKKGKGKRHMQMQMKNPAHRQAVIPWSAVTSWDETQEFMFVMFDIQGNKGSQIIPKRMQNNKFPLDTLRKHLAEVKKQGLETEAIQQ
ncbi:MAG: YcxB family protein [Moraxellaceae bacterium]|nr:YcxB family protein [Moraxellaceae bacterium]